MLHAMSLMECDTTQLFVVKPDGFCSVFSDHIIIAWCDQTIERPLLRLVRGIEHYLHCFQKCVSRCMVKNGSGI